MPVDEIVAKPASSAATPSLGGAPATRAVQDQINFNEGPVLLVYPTNLSERSLADMNDWLALIARKIQRVVKEKIV